MKLTTGFTYENTIANSTRTRITRPRRSQWIRLAGAPRVRLRGATRYARALTLHGFGGAALLSCKGAEPRIRRAVPQLLLDPQQLVVLGHAVRPRGGPGLDLARAGGHCEVGDRRVLRLAGA